MYNDDTRYSVPATWSRFYNELKGTPWDDQELDLYRCWHNDPSDIAPAINTLKHVFDQSKDWKGADQEAAVLAVLVAAHKHYGSIFLTSSQVKEMARNFSVFYADKFEPMQGYLDENHGGLRWDGLTGATQSEVTKAVIGESEIWVEETEGGVWVFNKPGT